MGADAITTIDFGAWPGTSEISLAIIGQASIVAGSRVEAWLIPTATVDHSADEHLLDPPRIIAGNVVAATGFTIYGYAPDNIFNSLLYVNGVRAEFTTTLNRLYGLYTIGWVWN